MLIGTRGVRWGSLAAQLGDLVLLSSPLSESSSYSRQRDSPMDPGGQGLLNPVYTKASFIHVLVSDFECIMVLNVRMEKRACSQTQHLPLQGDINYRSDTRALDCFACKCHLNALH